MGTFECYLDINQFVTLDNGLISTSQQSMQFRETIKSCWSQKVDVSEVDAFCHGLVKEVVSILTLFATTEN